MHLRSLLLRLLIIHPSCLEPTSNSWISFCLSIPINVLTHSIESCITFDAPIGRGFMRLYSTCEGIVPSFYLILIDTIDEDGVDFDTITDGIISFLCSLIDVSRPSNSSTLSSN